MDRRINCRQCFLKKMKTITLLLIWFLPALASSVHAVEVINAGIGGNRSSPLLQRLAHHPDVVVIMAGTNDRLNSGGFVNIDTYRKNMEELVDKTRKADSEVILVTPPPCIPDLLFTRHDPAKFSDQGPNERMEEVRSVLLKISEEKNVPLVDFHGHLIENEISENNEKSVLLNLNNSDRKDGVHLTSRGYEILAELVAAKIRDLTPVPQRVVCFGDSLTQGPNKAEVATVTGKNYPAFLKKLLNSD